MILAEFLLFAKLLVVLFGLLYSSTITTAAEKCDKDDPCCFPPEVMNISGIGVYTWNRKDCIFVRVVLKEWHRTTYFKPKHFEFPYIMQQTMFSAPLSYAGVIRLAYINVHVLSIDEKTQQISADGSMHLEWKDERFVWDSSFKTNYVVITIPESRIWIPKILFQGQVVTHSRIVIANGGQITYRVWFSISNQCPFDYSRYPFDSHTCCSTIYYTNQFNFSSTTTSRTVKDGNNLISSGVFDNPIGRSRLWSEIEYKITEKPVDRSQFPVTGSDFCFTFKRASGSVTTEIVLPLAVTIFLSVLTPMFGSWKVQALSKALCLCLQFACSFVLTLDTEVLQFGSGTPRLLRLHQLVIWTTALSLVSTLVLWSLATKYYKNRKFALPPPSKVIKVCAFINKLLWWCSCEEDDDDDDGNNQRGEYEMTGVGGGARSISDVVFANDAATVTTNRNNEEEEEPPNENAGAENSGSRQPQSPTRRMPPPAPRHQSCSPWDEVWLAANRLMQVIFAYVYLIGTLCLVIPV